MRKSNPTTTKHCFSNGTEFINWQDNNCGNCVKAIWYNEKTDSYPQYRCAIQRDIEAQSAGLLEINQRSYEVAQQQECPFKKTERKIHKKRKIKNQTELNMQLL